MVKIVTKGFIIFRKHLQLACYAACDVEWILQSAKYMSAGCIYNNCCSISKQHVKDASGITRRMHAKPFASKGPRCFTPLVHVTQRHCIGVDIVKVLNKAVQRQSLQYQKQHSIMQSKFGATKQKERD